MSNSDGGPAFPKNGNYGFGGSSQDGMSLRDWFAGMFVQGMLAGGWKTGDPIAYIRDAYKLASVMLKERENND